MVTGGDGAPCADGGEGAQRRFVRGQNRALELGHKRLCVLHGGSESQLHALGELGVRQRAGGEALLYVCVHTGNTDTALRSFAANIDGDGDRDKT